MTQFWGIANKHGLLSPWATVVGTVNQNIFFSFMFGYGVSGGNRGKSSSRRRQLGDTRKPTWCPGSTSGFYPRQGPQIFTPLLWAHWALFLLSAQPHPAAVGEMEKSLLSAKENWGFIWMFHIGTLNIFSTGTLSGVVFCVTFSIQHRPRETKNPE